MNININWRIPLKNEGMRLYASLFLVFTLVAFLTGTMLDLSGLLTRAELQNIDRLFEARRWIYWNAESLKRLNPKSLIEYHESHEIPRRWWAWDYTLSWLIEPNHIPVIHKIVMFNHQLEDEPPLEAAEHFPWMKPLMQWPYSRAMYAETLEFLARSGAKLIIMDNDFPQYSKDDAKLARAIYDCYHGKFGRKVPVLMAATVNHRSFANVLQLDMSSGPVGILRELAKLDPDIDVQERYTGTTSMLLDEDQVVRQMAAIVPDRNSGPRYSMAVKVLSSIGETVPPNLPREMDIDFAGPPNSEMYPVRPFSYLLDPDLQKRITSNDPNIHDVKLKDAIVILGDGVTDLYPAPYTNLGVNLMSGPEILAQSIETVSRRSWHYRLQQPFTCLYLFLCSALGGVLVCVWKRLYGRFLNGSKTRKRFGLGFDLACCVFLISLSFFVACLLFSFGRLIVPVAVPITALVFAFLATAIWERESERARLLKEQLERAEERLVLQQEKHDEELKRQLAEAHIQEMVQDEQRRKEFVRRINHDLKAPVTVMSWILSKLIKGGLSPEVVTEKIEKLAKTSNRLVDLLHELARSYEAGGKAAEEDDAKTPTPCQLNKILADCFAMAKPLAEMKADTIIYNPPERILWVTGDELHLSRVFDNLIRNAIIHNPTGIEIHIETRSRAHVHQIFISDTGTGMEAEKVKKLFDAEAVEERQKANPGSGMGLQIVKTFVESWGGKISAKSEVGSGTIFTITLPSSHLEAGGESGDDILSTGQYPNLKEALLVASIDERRGTDK